ncbi:MAG: hypothetical protein J6X03_04310 [Bacilli bacterium]|nr:hypothetical protein [Bacilli bacterium]
MPGNYLVLDKYTKNGGNIEISTKVFNTLAVNSLKQIPEIKRDKANLVQTNIVKNKLFYRITVVVSKGTNFRTLNDKIENTIIGNLNEIAETVPVDIKVKFIEKELKH